MEFLNSIFGWRAPSSPAQSPQSAKLEKRLLEVESPHPRAPLSEAFTKSESSKPSQPRSDFQSQPIPRQTKAPVVFLSGIAFTALSLLITRRSFARRRLTTKLPFHDNSPAHAQAETANVSAPMEAFEALNIATINVISLAMLSTGGALWYFDIASMEDAKRKVRGGLGVDGSGRSEGEVEEDFEEWLATVLSRKEAKERRREYEGEKQERIMNERGKER